MLKGRLPFDAAEEDKMLWRIVKSKPRYDPDWAPETLDVLRSMLQKRPTTRLSSLKTLGHAKLYASYDWAKLEACKLQGRTRERNSQLQSLLARPFSTRFG